MRFEKRFWVQVLASFLLLPAIQLFAQPEPKPSLRAGLLPDVDLLANIPAVDGILYFATNSRICFPPVAKWSAT